MKAAILVLLIPFFAMAKDDEKDNINRFSWNNIILNLPFSPEWAVQKPRKKPHDPLNFMDANAPSPRVIANLSETKFDLDSKDFSDFKIEFIKSKSAWVKKSQGTITQNPIVSFDNKEKLFRYEFSFAVSQGNYKEFGHFQRCSEKVAFSLRVMIPEEKFKHPSAEVTRIIDFFRKASACIH